MVDERAKSTVQLGDLTFFTQNGKCGDFVRNVDIDKPHFLQIPQAQAHGSISGAEFKKVLSRVGIRASDSELLMLIKRFDVDGDGHISAECCNGCAPDKTIKYRSR